MDHRSELIEAIAGMIRGNLANPFYAGPEPASVDAAQAAERVLQVLGQAPAEHFPLHADSHGVRFFLAPVRPLHRLFALVWDGAMWRTAGEWQAPPEVFAGGPSQAAGR